MQIVLTVMKFEKALFVFLFEVVGRNRILVFVFVGQMHLLGQGNSFVSKTDSCKSICQGCSCKLEFGSRKDVLDDLSQNGYA